MDRVLDSPFISLQPVEFTPHASLGSKQDPSDSGSSSRVRRFHHKSRTGCAECKNKRRKCNEERPRCQGCTKSNVECHYSEYVPPRAQPKNRKRPQRKQGINRFVFIEFGKHAPDSDGIISREDASRGDGREDVSLLRSSWQSAPTTCLLLGGLCTGDVHDQVQYLHLFRTFTYKTLSMNLYNAKVWKQVTFESTYSSPYFYNILLAVSIAHHRYLHVQPTRTPQEISCYVKCLSAFRAALSDRTAMRTMSPYSWVTVLVTAGLLSLYIMSCPVDSFETSFETYYSLSRGAMIMLSQTISLGIPMPLHPSGWTHRSTTIKQYTANIKFHGLDFAASGESRALTVSSLHRLIVILSAVEAERMDTMDNETALNLLKMSLEWVCTTDTILIQRFREKDRKAYIVIAHFYAGLWKIREVIRNLCQSGLWKEAGGSIETFWWLRSPPELCIESVRRLSSEPKEHISWVLGVISELNT